MTNKNLGHATAYAYYKAGGGTMTEAEFTEFMADFGTASQTAVEAARAALASETAAQTAATTATNKASEATTAAQTATTKAGEASTSASTATSAKDTAVSASQTATTKATEATTAAATATSAATTATTAKDDAVSAKTAAQTAQTGAETAAASVSGSAAQIQTNAEDISQLKSEFTATGTLEDIAFSESDCQQGLWGASVGAYDSNHTNAICSKNYVPRATIKLSCSDGYKMRLQAWEGNTYKGIWNGSGFVTQNPNYFQTAFDLFALSQSFPNYTYKFVLFASDGTSEVSPTDAVNVYAQYSKWTNQEVLNDGIDSVLDYTDKATWEVGSIYSDNGTDYDQNTRAIRTSLANRFFCPSGVVINTNNPSINTLFAFRYSEFGEYMGRLGAINSKTLTIQTDGYYRFVLLSSVDIDSSVISSFSDGFTIMGKVLSKITADMSQAYAYHVTGKKIDLSAQGFSVGQRFPLPSTSIHDGLTARQDFDVYNDVLFQLYSDNYVALVNNTTGAVITHYAIDSGHGNACQFSDEFYDPNDTYPLLYCFAYTTNLVYVNRVTDSGATLVRTYKLDTAGYRFSGGIDVKNNQLVTIHYINNSSLDATNNGCKISVWDLSDTTTDENDGTLKPALIKQTEVAFLPVIQGCTVFKDVLYVCNGYENPNIPVKITGYNKDGDIVTEVADFPTAIVNSEAESITFYRTDNKYKCYFATYRLYELVFE